MGAKSPSPLPGRSQRASAPSPVAVWVFNLVVVGVLCGVPPPSEAKKCEFQAIFNFGDSNSDTGGFWAAFPAQKGPYGVTYFKRPSGRASDGRLLIDFLAQAVGFPFLSPYLQSIGSDYRHGANYATLASTVRVPNTSLFVSGISPFCLPIQLNQMKQFRIKVLELSPKGIPKRAMYIEQKTFTAAERSC